MEKSSSFNCRSGEYALLNGSLNKRWGRENIVDEDVVVDRLMRECTYRNKRSILKKWASHAHEVMDWFIEAYPELTICDSTQMCIRDRSSIPPPTRAPAHPRMCWHRDSR